MGSIEVEAKDYGLPEISLAVPGYRLQHLIGAGGMGEVHRATQLSLERPVAIKFLHLQGNDQSRLSAFQRESRLMAALAHPHVVTIHDCGHFGNHYYLVMEYVDGSTLRARMTPGRSMTFAEAVRIIDAIAQGLAYIHARGFLHLDLKPENVLSTRDGAVKITDFGLAAPRDRRSPAAYAYGSKGTIDYCAPEQRHSLPVDQRSDIYSLGTITYELLTGELPSRVYVRASERNPALPAALDPVLARALARDIDDRYSSVEEFRRELANAVVRRSSQGTRWPMVAAGVAMIAALLFVYWGAP
jgi:serine/threonine protein kinase